MNMRHTLQKKGRRHQIRISAEPRSATTRALLRRLTREVQAFAKKWEAHVEKQKAKPKPKRRGGK